MTLRWNRSAHTTMERNRTFIHVRPFMLLTQLTQITVRVFAETGALNTLEAKRGGIIELDFLTHDTRSTLLSLTLGHIYLWGRKNLITPSQYETTSRHLYHDKGYH